MQDSVLVCLDNSVSLRCRIESASVNDRGLPNCDHCMLEIVMLLDSIYAWIMNSALLPRKPLYWWRTVPLSDVHMVIGLDVSAGCRILHNFDRVCKKWFKSFFLWIVFVWWILSLEDHGLRCERRHCVVIIVKRLQDRLFLHHGHVQNTPENSNILSSLRSYHNPRERLAAIPLWKLSYKTCILCDYSCCPHLTIWGA